MSNLGIKGLRKHKSLLAWLPVFIWLEIIFILSSIPAAELPAMPSEGWHFWAHRTAHILEYAVLGVLVIRAYTHDRPYKGLGTVFLLALFILLAGLFDEWHQSFVPGRDCELLDAMFDTVCGTFGMLLYKICFYKKLMGKNPKEQ